MTLKTVTAASMAEALALVKRELGPGAVILHTRSYKRGGVLGLGARTVVEITAADRGEIAARQTRRAAAPGMAAAAPLARPARVPAAIALAEPMAGDLIRRTYAAARAEMAHTPAPAAAAIPPQERLDTVRGAVAPTQLADEMRAVKEMVTTLVRQQRRGDGLAAGVPEKLFDQYLSLLKQDLAEELACDVCKQVSQTLSAAEMEDEAAVSRAMRDALAKLLSIDATAGKLQPTEDGRPRIVALIGPTGVGKTTTIAKLAATFKLKHKKSIGLITLDTFRIAAVEQLRTYANIIGVPLHVAMSTEELQDALHKCARCDLVFIDTAGRSQRDDPRLEQLKGFLAAARPHEVHLVLSSTCSQPVLLETIDRFSVVRADRIIFTKLDEAVTFGVLVNVAHKVNKRLSYLTTGQEVPHQIEPGRADRLAQLVLRGEM